ncbi:MAG TPA: hypothetical protein PLH94_01610 [Fimbriimonadaceae bacterium]|nr:hypothetical protein [Fimbriimonadaceae bacterium]
MKKLLPILALSAIAVAANAQIANPPFFTPLVEDYDTMAAGVYPTFPAMSGNATVTAITGALMDVGNFTFLPPWNGLQCMYGISTDVQWRFNFGMRRFGGRWRSASTATTGFRMRFYTLANTLWFTSPVLPINTTSWQWYGYWTFVFVGSVIIEGVPTPGYVGHDNTRARWW